MSAIFGIWNISGEPINKKDIDKMKDTLLQYGRASQDIYINNNIALGCCLRKDNGIAENELPVISDKDNSLVMVADAQIFNRKELIEVHQLTNYDRITNNGLLIAAYKKWGVECPKYINGAFSFAIWNEKIKKLTVVEDQLGVRPIYYFYNKEIFAFATDYRALLAMPFVSMELYEQKMYCLFSGEYKIEPEATYFKNIKAVPQAHMLHIDSENLTIKKYWTPGQNKLYDFKDESECIKTLYNLVEDAVKIRLDYVDSRVGVELSGGLDSSVITVLANHELNRKNDYIEPFSWSPPISAMKLLENDEREFIEEICQKEKLSCNYFDNNDINNENTIMLPPDMANPAVFSQEFNLFKSKGVDVVLSGWGGDQGISHRASLFELFMNGCKKEFFKEIIHQSKGSPIKFGKLLIGNTVLRLFGKFKYFSKPDKINNILIKKDFSERVKKSFKKDILYFTVNPVKHVESGNIQTRTQLSAWISADYDMLCLFPYLDYRVMDFALSVPRHFYYKNGVNRYIYRKAFEHLFSEKHINYMYKNDFARWEYAQEKVHVNLKANIINAINAIDTIFYSQYFNFNELVEYVKSIDDKHDIFILFRIFRHIKVCKNLQMLIMEYKKQ